MSSDEADVIVIGAGVAGLSAALFTSRAGLETLGINTGSSILNRNAHLENYPGFPRGIDPRLLLEMMRDQVEYNGSHFIQSSVQKIRNGDGDKFSVKHQGEVALSRRIIIASWSNLSFIDELGIDTYSDGSKDFLITDDNGKTSVEGIYAAGRITGIPHQTIVAAGNGAEVGIQVVEDLKPKFYHDWTAPEGYFTNRGREVPPGCEEISEEERSRRDERSREVLMDYLNDPSRGEPTPHPSQSDE